MDPFSLWWMSGSPPDGTVLPGRVSDTELGLEQAADGYRAMDEPRNLRP